MEEQNPPALSSAAKALPWTRLDWGLVLVLLLLAAGIRTWLVEHTAVAARDSIGFIRYTWQLQQQPWGEVLRRNAHPPLYPLAIWGASVPVRWLASGPDSALMQSAAQLVSALAGGLLVLPMFFLGRDLWDRKVGFWAAALFQCLPVAARVTSDAVSEGVFLLLTATALALAIRALRSRSLVMFALCGLFGSFAYLTRPEGLFVPAATGLVLLAGQAVPGWRRPWGKVLASGAALGLAGLIVAGPYMGVIGGLTNKPAARQLMGLSDGAGEKLLPETRVVPRAGAGKGPLVGLMLAVWQGPLEGGIAQAAGRRFYLAVWQGPLEGPGGRLAWGLRAVTTEGIKDFHYVSWLPALMGLWVGRRLLRTTPGAWVLLLVGVQQVLAVGGVAVVRGYLSERHVLVLVLCGTFWAVVGMMAIAERLAGRWRLAEIGLLVALTGFGLPEVLKTLHANRAGHHAAGRWLAEHARPADPVLDPFSWANFYAGRVFQETHPPRQEPGYQPSVYVVLEHSKNEHARLPMVAVAQLWAQRGTPVYHCPVHEYKNPEDEVVIYRVPPD